MQNYPCFLSICWLFPICFCAKQENYRLHIDLRGNLWYTDIDWMKSISDGRRKNPFLPNICAVAQK